MSWVKKQRSLVCFRAVCSSFRHVACLAHTLCVHARHAAQWRLLFHYTDVDSAQALHIRDLCPLRCRRQAGCVVTGASATGSTAQWPCHVFLHPC